MIMMMLIMEIATTRTRTTMMMMKMNQKKKKKNPCRCHQQHNDKCTLMLKYVYSIKLVLMSNCYPNQGGYLTIRNTNEQLASKVVILALNDIVFSPDSCRESIDAQS